MVGLINSSQYNINIDIYSGGRELPPGAIPCPLNHAFLFTEIGTLLITDFGTLLFSGYSFYKTGDKELINKKNYKLHCLKGQTFSLRPNGFYQSTVNFI